MSRWQPKNASAFAVFVQVVPHAGGWRVRAFVYQDGKRAAVITASPNIADTERYAKRVAKRLLPMRAFVLFDRPGCVG